MDKNLASFFLTYGVYPFGRAFVTC